MSHTAYTMPEPKYRSTKKRVQPVSSIRTSEFAQEVKSVQPAKASAVQDSPCGREHRGQGRRPAGPRSRRSKLLPSNSPRSGPLPWDFSWRDSLRSGTPLPCRPACGSCASPSPSPCSPRTAKSASMRRWRRPACAAVCRICSVAHRRPDDGSQHDSRQESQDRDPAGHLSPLALRFRALAAHLPGELIAKDVTPVTGLLTPKSLSSELIKGV